MCKHSSGLVLIEEIFPIGIIWVGLTADFDKMCIRDRYNVVYVGKSSKSLRIRDYKQHFTGTAGNSTIRKSLGCLLAVSYTHLGVLRETYATVDVILGGNRVTDLITLLKNKRMIVQENGRKYTFKPDFHY